MLTTGALPDKDYVRQGLFIQLSVSSDEGSSVTKNFHNVTEYHRQNSRSNTKQLVLRTEAMESSKSDFASFWL